PWPANRRKIRQVLEAEQLDILHVQMPHSPFMAQKVINIAPPQTAIIGTFHILPSGWVASFGARLLRLFYGLGLGRIDKIISVSPPAANFAKSAFGLDSEVLPNSIDLDSFQKLSKDIPNIRGHIVFLGRLVKR